MPPWSCLATRKRDDKFVIVSQIRHCGKGKKAVTSYNVLFWLIYVDRGNLRSGVLFLQVSAKEWQRVRTEVSENSSQKKTTILTIPLHNFEKYSFTVSVLFVLFYCCCCLLLESYYLHICPTFFHRQMNSTILR